MSDHELKQRVRLLKNTRGYENLDAMVGKEAARTIYDAADHLLEDCTQVVSISAIEAWLSNNEYWGDTENGRNSTMVIEADKLRAMLKARGVGNEQHTTRPKPNL